jgi:signal transduction histidine kinase
MVLRKSAVAVAAVYLAIAVVSVLHYVAPVHAHHLHDIYRRLYYLPIIVAAFQNGWKGGLIAALVVCAAYAPHAFGHISHDPASDTQKILEMLLYLAVGLTTGSLVSRLKGTQRQLQGSLEQLRSTEDQLIRAARLAAVGRLSAGLAHEIRNPLASIKGSAELLADDFPPGHRKRRLLDVLVDEADRLNHVLTRFLAFARPRPLERQVFEVGPEVEAVVALLQGQKEGKPVRFIVDPGPSAPTRIRGDREQLRQVLLNVLINASQAAGEGGTVRIRCLTTEGSLRFSVHDSGSGFTPEALENAFTPFFTTKDQGSGLGLAISHRIVESHGGRIRIANHEDGGGWVEIEIPLEASDGAHPPR